MLRRTIQSSFFSRVLQLKLNHHSGGATLLISQNRCFSYGDNKQGNEDTNDPTQQKIMSTYQKIVKVDYTNTQQSTDLCNLLNSYAMDPKGGGEPIDSSILSSLPSQLQKFGHATSFIVYIDTDDGRQQPAALANCILSFSTFAAKPILNIHDVFVDVDFRGRGLSQALLKHGMFLTQCLKQKILLIGTLVFIYLKLPTLFSS